MCNKNTTFFVDLEDQDSKEYQNDAREKRNEEMEKLDIFKY